MDKVKKLIGVSDFDTAKNVYFTLVLAKELKCKPEDLIDNIHQVKCMTVDKRAAKFLFEAILDCSIEEQITLISILFKYYEGDLLIALARALNTLEDGI